MSIERYRNDNPRSAEEVADALEFELQQINSSLPVVAGTQNYAYVNSLAATLAEQQEQSLNELYDTAFITDATGKELTKKAREIGVERRDAVPATGVAKFSRPNPASTDRVVPSGTEITTGGENPVNFVTTEVTTIDSGSTTTDSTLYSTSSDTFSVQTSFTVDTTYRETVDVSGDIRTTNNAASAELDVVDSTNGITIDSFSTTATTLTTVGPTTYDVSSLTGEITIEFQLRITNTSYTAELDESTVTTGGEVASLANIECTEPGPEGNVGANTIVSIIDKPAGVESVTNPNPTGDPSFTLTNGTTPLSTGAAEESDNSLRERALDSAAIGGAGTADAVELAIENIDDVISADVLTNRTSSTVNGIDPWHTEIRVYGGNANDIANRLYEVLPLGSIKTLQGGVNGTLDQVSLDTGPLYGTLDFPLTRPTEVALDITIDLVHTSEYAGTETVKNEIVEYVGGTTTDQRTEVGIGQGVDVIANEVENVAEDVTGVDAVTNSVIDDNDDGSDDTTTDSDGVRVYAVSDSDVAIVDAADITINETAR